MNVLSSYLWSSRSSLSEHDTSKIAISKSDFLLFSLARSTLHLLLRICKRSCRCIVNKPPLLSLKAICGQWSYRDVGRHAVDRRHITKLNAMTLSKHAHRSLLATCSPPSLLLSRRSLNCKMPMSGDNVFALQYTIILVILNLVMEMAGIPTHLQYIKIRIIV